MKLTPRHLFAAVLFGLLLAPVLSYADYMPAERQLERLENIVTLSSTQKSEALQIYQNLKDVMDDMNPTDRPVKGAQSRQDALAAIRSILTPGQQKIYDQTPQRLGGDLGTDPVMRNLHQKISVFVTSYVRTSPAIAAQVGTVQQVFPVNGGSTTNWNGNSTDPAAVPFGGSNVMKVTGSSGTKSFKISWTMSPAGAMTVTGFSLAAS